MNSDKQQKNDFVRERIKDKPINKKRILGKMGLSVMCGMVFGAAAYIATWVCAPFLVREPAGDRQAQEDTEPSGGQMIFTEQEDTSAQQEELPQQELQQPEITMEIFQDMQERFYEAGRSANRSIVIINSVTSDASRFHTMYEKQGQASGVIFREKDEEYLILAQEAKFAGASQIAVTFVNGSVAQGELLGYDGKTNLAVISVKKSDMDSAAVSALAVNPLSGSVEVSQGTLTLLLGSGIGAQFSVLAGSVVSTGEDIPLIDGNYHSFTTDIVSDDTGRGIIVNAEGEVAGLVMKEQRPDRSQGPTVTAVCIAELLPLVKTLSSGKDSPYVGLYVSTVTDELAENYGLPSGVYIDSVLVDSPAMTGGLKSGDVITQINDRAISSDGEYKSAVRELTPGDVCEVTVSRQNGEGYSQITCEVVVGVY